MDTIELTLNMVYENPRGEAWLISDGDTEVWLPKSVVTFDGDKTFIVPVWLAEEKGLV